MRSTSASSSSATFSQVVAAALAGLPRRCSLTLGISRDREVVLQPVLQSAVTVSSAGVSRQYLEMITRDVVVLTLDRSPQNLEYWMNQVLAITSPRAQGKLKGDLLKIVNEQRGSSIAQFFTIQSMEIDPKNLRSEVTGELHTIVGNKVISNERRTFRYDWEYEACLSAWSASEWSARARSKTNDRHLRRR